MKFLDNIYTKTDKKRVAVTGDVVSPSKDMVHEIYRSNPKNSVLEKVKNKVMLKADVTNNMLQSPINVSWLPFAAGYYNISPDINDYVAVTAPVLTSDIPNRNMQGFMTKTLFEFDPEYACQRYKTYVGRPLCKNHQNKDLSMAQGIVVDAFIMPVPKYKLVKVMCLFLVDRTKCQLLPTVLQYGGRYSIGSMASAFVCSICGGILGPGCQRTCTCYQSNYDKLGTYGKVYNGRLHFLMCLDPVFGELSILSEDPADFSAVGAMV